MPTKLSRKLVYQNCVFLTSQSKTLEDLLREGLGHKPLAAHRARNVSDSVRQVLNDNLTVGNTLCGIFWNWEDGRNQIVFDQEPTAAVWRVQPVRPPTVTGPQSFPRHFLESLVYFGVRGNHLILVQTQALRSGHLADYFTWFLRDQCQLLPGGEKISFSPASAAKLRAAGVHRASAITVKKGLAETVSLAPPPGTRRRRPILMKQIQAVIGQRATGMLSALGINIPESVLTTGDAKDLEITLEIARPYDRSELGNSAMLELAQRITQMTSDEYVVHLSGGGTLKGSSLALSTKVNVSGVGGNPSSSEMFREIDAYLNGLVTRGEV